MMVDRAPVRMTEASAAAAAAIVRSALHHGGNTAATASASERTFVASAATMKELKIRKTQAFIHAERSFDADVGAVIMDMTLSR